jgi:hypothetical protein
MGTITKNCIIIILFEKNYNEEIISVLSSLETSSSPGITIILSEEAYCMQTEHVIRSISLL